MSLLCIPIGIVLQIIAHAPQFLFYYLKSILLLFVPQTFQHKKDITGQTVLITGAGGSLGRQQAIEFAKHSTRLVLLDLNKSALMETQGILGPDVSSFVYECDVSDRQKVFEVADAVKRDVGKVDILVNNAGIMSGKRFLDIPEEKIQKTMEVNILAHFWTCKAFLPGMRKENKGHIVSIASVAGLFGACNLADYCASKFAVVGFMQSLSMEMEADNLKGVKLTTVCPMVIDTTLSAGMKPSLGVHLKPEEVAKTVVKAVIQEKEVFLIPEWTHILHLLCVCAPIKVFKSFSRQNGLLTHMDAFQGNDIHHNIISIPDNVKTNIAT